MKKQNVFLAILPFLFLGGCASGYQSIHPERVNYRSKNVQENVVLEYRYDLLSRKYAKKELKRDVRLVAIKITNNSDQDLRFGDDIHLAYGSGQPVVTMDGQETFKKLKQSPASHLLYLLLTPVNLYISESNGLQQETTNIPIGLVLGPGLAAGNMITAGSANKKFKNDIMDYDLTGTIIGSGETVHGLIGIRTNNFEALTLSFPLDEEHEEQESVDLLH